MKRRKRTHRRRKLTEKNRYSLSSFFLSFGIFSGMVSVLVAVGFFYVKARLQVLEVGYRVAEVEKQFRELTREHEHLELEAVVLRSPERIVLLAEKELSLQFPRPEQIRIVRGE